MKRRVISGLGVALLFLAACSQQLEPQLGTENVSRSKTDFTEAPRTLTQTEYAVVAFADAPTASYQGGTNGLKATKPARGAKLDPDSPAVKAYVRHLENQHANFRSFLRRNAPGAEVVDSTTLVLNAVTVKLNGASLQSLARGPKVRAVAYSGLYRPTMNKSVEIIEADTFWQTTGLTGQGVKVGVIDSGIDESHPFFACKGNIQNKVYASGVAFDPGNLLVLDHGTHVAGTVAGCAATEGPLGITFSGVAPSATLFDYNVFPGFGAGYVAYGGSAFSHDIARALEDAVADGMDVVNMSLGGGVQGPNDFLAEAANATVDAGVVVVAAAGNSGPGSSTVGSPGSAEKVITVGATTNSHVIGTPVTVDFGNSTASYLGAEGDFDPFAEKPANQQPLVSAAAYGNELACTALSSVPENTVVLIKRGACTFSTKIANAAAAGAFGAIVYNSNANEGPVSMAGEGTIPAIGISLEAGQAILAGLTTSTTVTINGNVLEEFSVEPDILAAFSSRGPTAFTGLIKPDLTAPGVNVLSSVFGGEFALLNGTSMASPHVAGAAALLLAAHGDWAPEDVKAALVTGTDVPKTLANLSYAERGNGRLNVMEANSVPVLISPPSVSFGYHNQGGRSKVSEVTLTLRSASGSAVSCTAAPTGDVTVSSSSLSVAPEATVTVSLNDASNRSGNAEGEIVFSCGGETLNVPWASYQR
jgi:minor extracellular serine protease Vpr